MSIKNVLATALTLALCGAAQAQSSTTCSCDSSAARTQNGPALSALLGTKMVCANVGSEVWQEWHNGPATGLSSGQLVDYKLGSDPRDRTSPVGTYAVNSNNTVTYSYTGGGSYTYDVGLVATSGTYTFCGAAYGGRNITGARIGGGGAAATSCASVTGPTGNITRTR